MGTINYKTSDFITIGYNCDHIDFEDEYRQDIIQDYFDQTEYKLNQKDFYYFHVTIEPGYYEGFSINIEFNYPVCFDNYREKQDAQKEITQIRAFLYNCVSDYECCAVSPGWCTTYYNYETSLKKIDAAVREMRETVKQTPTYNQYFRGEVNA